MEEGKIDNLLKLLEIVDSESEKAYKSFFEFTDVFTEKLIEEKRKLPYHINVIDELSANENANSRILSALLQYTDNGEYVLLKSFVKNVLSDFNIEVKHPYITTENLRIDLLVRENKEKDKYAIIFENKIHNAVQQKNQLARYIIKLRNEGFRDNEIYVVFMPPYMYEPNDCCWHEPQDVCENCDRSKCLIESNPELKEIFKSRYKVVTFRDDVILWLKEYVVPNCRQKEVYLYTASMQYLDYLEGYFYLRTINKGMSMNLDKIIINYMKLEDCQSDKERANMLQERINDMQEVIGQMESLKSKYWKSYQENIFASWKKQTKEMFPNMHPNEAGYYTDVSFHIDGEKVLAYITEDKDGIYCQINFDSQKNISDTKIMKLKDILPEEHATARWKYFSSTDFDGVYNLFKEVAMKCREMADK